MTKFTLHQAEKEVKIERYSRRLLRGRSTHLAKMWALNFTCNDCDSVAAVAAIWEWVPARIKISHKAATVAVSLEVAFFETHFT